MEQRRSEQRVQGEMNNGMIQWRGQSHTGTCTHSFYIILRIALHLLICPRCLCATLSPNDPARHCVTKHSTLLIWCLLHCTFTNLVNELF